MLIALMMVHADYADDGVCFIMSMKCMLMVLMTVYDDDADGGAY